jgi:hypothetical protein
LLISWFIMRALEELSQREVKVAGDMRGSEIRGQEPGDGRQESGARGLVDAAPEAKVGIEVKAKVEA